METGNKISDNNISAGQVKTLPGDCCFKETGIFAIVPNDLLTDNNTTDFLPREKHLRRKLTTETVRIDDNISIVSERGENHPVVQLLRQSLSEENANLTVNLIANKLYIVATAEGKIMFANYFEVNSEEDVLYYLLAVCEHLELPVSQTCILSVSKIPDNIKQYFEVRKVVL